MLRSSLVKSRTSLTARSKFIARRPARDLKQTADGGWAAVTSWLYHLTAFLLKWETTTGTVITFQDLTHIRALEETSRRQDRLAAIGRMAASIAHEIRNPLAAMRGSIQMLRADMESDASQTELMEIILRESDRLNRIISDFLSYARPRSIIQTKVNVGELLQQTFMLLRPQRGD